MSAGEPRMSDADRIRLEFEQARYAQEALDAITGGEEVDRFLAARVMECAAELSSISSQLEQFIAALPPRVPTRWELALALARRVLARIFPKLFGAPR